MTTRRTVLASSLAAFGGCLGRVSEVESTCPAPVSTNETVRLGFVGDVMLGRNVNDRWRDEPAGVWDGMLDRIDALDGLLLNLECCVSARGERRPGREYYFQAHPDWAIPALERAGTAFASSANNHVLDYGPTALTDTLAHLDAAGIPTAGAGRDRESAFEPAVFAVDDLDVAVVAATDQSPSYAARGDAAGSAYAPLKSADRLTRNWVGDAVVRARERDPDLLVVSLHWGPNWEVEPSETQRSFARWLIDRGADVVHGHSAHVIQGVETYRGRPIIYDAGDFVDDYVVKDGLHNNWSFLFELAVSNGTLTALDLVPVEIERERVTPAGGTAARWLRDRMRTLSAPFETTFERRDAGLRIPLGEC
ncbi:CapA family protein [Halomicroarcula limicola]|uniref:CapA family protein n=1 Tax=Haloarcula limicola TaxID=1429915 RepID=A0A8J7Y5E8_9EURY|nr:CapA family protein [Halomicroarcula limicola]MBV0925065.1 CapA family protein [Halomicroarcula limicola]